LTRSLANKTNTDAALSRIIYFFFFFFYFFSSPRSRVAAAVKLGKRRTNTKRSNQKENR